MISTTFLRSHSSRMCRLMLGRFMTCCQVHHDPVLGFLSLPVPPATPPLPCLDPASPLPHNAPRGPYPVSNGGVHPPQLVPISASSTTVLQCVPIFDQLPDISMIKELNPMDMQGQAGPSRGSGEGSPLVPGTDAQTTTIPMRKVLRRTATRDSCPPEGEPLQQRVWPSVTPTLVNSSFGNRITGNRMPAFKVMMMVQYFLICFGHTRGSSHSRGSSAHAAEQCCSCTFLIGDALRAAGRTNRSQYYTCRA